MRFRFKRGRGQIRGRGVRRRVCWWENSSIGLWQGWLFIEVMREAAVTLRSSTDICGSEVRQAIRKSGVARFRGAPRVCRGER